jgi:hypothetical protein
MRKVWFSILTLIIIIFGCTSKTDSVITGDITSVIVTLNYDKEKVAEITDEETINLLIQLINKSKREDISDVVWERGPDGTLLFTREEETVVVLRFFSENSPVDVIWTDNHRRYRIDTNFILADLLN